MTAVDKTMTIATTAAGIRHGGTNGVIRAVRSAESNRVASCLFADRIAQLSIAEYKSHFHRLQVYRVHKLIARKVS